VALFSCGLAMKVLLANPCGKIADTVFNAGPVPAMDAWYGLFAYAFQIFFDFAAYSEMAVGLGLMMGWVFAKNFETPYKSQAMTEFWRRWHISLSTWLRDYLYISIGGNRKGPSRTYLNLMITMLLGGLWHGASWNFLIWGGLHGAMLAVERKIGGALWRNWPAPLRVAATFGTVLLAWVFFRSADLPTAFVFLASLAGAAQTQNGAALVGGIIYQPYYVGSLIVAGVVAWCCPSAWNWTQTLPAWKAAVCLLLLWSSLLLLLTQAYNPFIYFIF
jgi:alginate O-acetyltransferase complex protein AlgI